MNLISYYYNMNRRIFFTGIYSFTENANKKLKKVHDGRNKLLKTYKNCIILIAAEAQQFLPNFHYVSESFAWTYHPEYTCLTKHQVSNTCNKFLSNLYA